MAGDLETSFHIILDSMPKREGKSQIGGAADSMLQTASLQQRFILDSRTTSVVTSGLMRSHSHIKVQRVC